jgi:hypothetical protein
MAKPNKSLNKILDLTDGYYFSFVPEVAIALESVNAALMLCYLVHWEGKGWKRDGWIYKTMEEMRTGTGLTKNQQESARKILKQRGFIQVERKGTHGIRHYLVNIENIELHLARLLKSSKHYEPPKPKHVNRYAAKPLFTFDVNRLTYTEETHNDTSITNPGVKINTSLPVGQVESQELRPDTSLDIPKILEGELVDTSFMDLFGNNSRGSPTDNDEIL